MNFRKSGKELLVFRQPMRLAGLGFFLLDHREERMIAREIAWEPFPPAGVYDPVPLFELGDDVAQQLIDGLWNAGLRPTQGRQSEGVTAAQACHLEDMRAIAFAKLNIDRPA